MFRRRLLALSGASLAGCVGDPTGATATGASSPPSTEPDAEPTTVTDGGTARPDGGSESVTLSSPAFEDGGRLPTRFSCAGEGVSPPLTVAGAPDGTEAFALVVDDPDAPGAEPFVHWLLWNLPPETTGIPADVPAEATVLGGARQGTNGRGDLGYFPACPPRGDGPHTYRFALFALEETLDVESGARRSAVQRAVDAARIAEARVTATFERNG